MASQLYLGQVMHERFKPFTYRFKYQVFSLKVDVDTIESESRNMACLGFNKFNLLSLKTKDFGSRSDKPWRTWFTELLANYGVNQHIAKIELVCMPRFLGYQFNPLAMWYGYDHNNKLVAVVAEVSNTFGQWHHYVLANSGEPLNASMDSKLLAESNKVFHVSPFMSMDCRYRFRFSAPDEHYKVGIYEQENGKDVLNAVQVGKSVCLNNKNLLKAAAKMPFNSLKVILNIHWWALKIWLKGGKFHKTPKHLQDIDYSHSEMNLC